MGWPRVEEEGQWQGSGERSSPMSCMEKSERRPRTGLGRCMYHVRCGKVARGGRTKDRAGNPSKERSLTRQDGYDGRLPEGAPAGRPG
jgi:hypothetical protein